MKTFYLTPENQGECLKEAVSVLSRGGLILYPTETMYGVGVDATNSAAVERLFNYKERPAGKAISVLVEDQSQAELYVKLGETACSLYTAFLPGPFTIVSESKGMVDSRLVSEYDSLGIRISSHPFASALAKAFGKPITASSANASGKARPYTIQTALDGLSTSQANLIDLIIDAGTLPKREPSTVIDTTKEVQEVLRAGEGLVDASLPIHSTSENHTVRIGSDLMKSFEHVIPEKPIVFALEGEMGAGKTRFAKGVAAALKVCGIVSSPTFTVMKEYEGTIEHNSVTLIHLDCWRVPEITPEELQLPEHLKPFTVWVIEWATPLLPFLRELVERREIVGYRILIDSKGEQERILRIGSL